MNRSSFRFFGLFWVLGLCGCVSLTQNSLYYAQVPYDGTEKFYVSGIGFSQALCNLKLSDPLPPESRCSKIRTRLVENGGGVFTANPDCPLHMSVEIDVSKWDGAKKGVEQKFPVPDEDGVSSQFVLFGWCKWWSLIYDMKIKVTSRNKTFEISKKVNSHGGKGDIFLYPGILVAFFPIPGGHFDGFELYPFMLDGYDWLMEKEFAEVMKSAVAEFELVQ